MRRIIGVATSVLIVTVVVGAPVAAARADAGLQWDSTMTYRVDTEAEDLTITSGGTALRYEVTEPEGGDADGWQLLEIRLSRRLFYRRSTDVRIEYDIRGDDPRSDGVFRINPAYASFGVTAWGIRGGSKSR